MCDLAMDVDWDPEYECVNPSPPLRVLDFAFRHIEQLALAFYTDCCRDLSQRNQHHV